MSILDRIEITCGDVRDIPADLLILKYADGLYGADFAVADRLGIDIHVPRHHNKFVEGAARPQPGLGIQAQRVLYRGVGPLFDFRYYEIRQFAYATLVTALEAIPRGGTLATTIHGPGYGLDEREAFSSQLQGYLDLADYATDPLARLTIVEQDADRAERLRALLKDYQNADTSDFTAPLSKRLAPGAPDDPFAIPPAPAAPHSSPKDIGPSLAPAPAPDTQIFHLSGSEPSNDFFDTFTPAAQPPEKPKLFAAMPFADKYLDEYHIGFVEAAHAHGYICERLDLEHYVGDVIDEIFKRIRNSAGVIALLNDNNANVFFEVGYAMALNKPVILVAHDDQEVAFDLRSQRRQTYSSIFKLRQDMTALIDELKQDGVLF